MHKAMVATLMALAMSSCTMREYSRWTGPDVEVVHARTSTFMTNTEAENISVKSDKDKRSLQVGKITVEVDSAAVGAITKGVVAGIKGF